MQGKQCGKNNLKEEAEFFKMIKAKENERRESRLLTEGEQSDTQHL